MNNCWIDTEFFDRYELEKGWDKEMKAKAAYVLAMWKAVWKIETLLDELKEAENETNTNTEG